MALLAQTGIQPPSPEHLGVAIADSCIRMPATSATASASYKWNSRTKNQVRDGNQSSEMKQDYQEQGKELAGASKPI